jgi:hypothetical protein
MLCVRYDYWLNDSVNEGATDKINGRLIDEWVKELIMDFLTDVWLIYLRDKYVTTKVQRRDTVYKFLDVSENCTASIFKVKEYIEQVTNKLHGVIYWLRQ